MQEFEFFTPEFKASQIYKKVRNKDVIIFSSTYKIICSLDSKASLIDDL